MSKCSSSAMTSSTVSRESAPRSSMNFALGVTSSSSTPSCSQMISFTRSSTGFAINALLTELMPRPPSAGGARSLHVQPSVDVNRLPGDVGCAVADQEPHHLGHLLWSPAPLERYSL